MHTVSVLTCRVAVRVGGCDYNTPKCIPHYQPALSLGGFPGNFPCPATLEPLNTEPANISELSLPLKLLQQHAPESVKRQHCYQTTAGLLCYTFMESCTGTQTMSLANLTRPRSNFKQAWVIQESIWLAFCF